MTIRWLIRRDMPEVLAIENASFEFPWTEEEFVHVLGERNCIGMVAEQCHDIRGFLVYELHGKALHILNFAVHPDYRRQGVGRRMVERMIDKLSQQRRVSLTLEVRETNTAAQLFWRAMGFRAVSILRDHYDDTDEDAYVFRYTLLEEGVLV